MNVQTGQVNAALRRYYKKDEYALMFEVGNATGSNTRRHADAVVMNLWPSRGLLIEGIEVKVTRGDWRRELENPAKAEEIAQFCDKWWIVAPEGIVQEHEVPALWGWMVVNEQGSIRVRKQAPKKSKEEITPLTRGFVAAMLRRASTADAVMIDALVEKKIAESAGTIQDRIKRGIDEATRNFKKAEEKLTGLKNLGLDLQHGWETAEQIIEYYELGKKLRHKMSADNLKYIRGQLDRASSAIGEVEEAFRVEVNPSDDLLFNGGSVQ